MSLTIYMGPMWASKTTSMLSDIERYNIAGLSTLLIKYKYDNRYSSDNSIITHSMKKYSSINGAVITVDDLTTIRDLSNIHTIGIDEFQFYKGADQVVKWIDKGINVIISTLDADYKSIMFDNVVKIIPFADKVIKLNAVCNKCLSFNAIATRHKYMNNNPTDSKSAYICIGGNDIYTVICNKCRRSY